MFCGGGLNRPKSRSRNISEAAACERLVAKKEREQLIRQVRGIEGDIQGGFSQFMGAKNNPISFGKNKVLGALGKAGLYGVIAKFVIDMGQQVFDSVISEMKSFFKAGGVFDIRKDVLNELKQVANLDHMIAVQRGEVFFTSDTAEILRQGVPQTSNTREKVNGHKQYIQEFDR